jgi:hypothetical protein
LASQQSFGHSGFTGTWYASCSVWGVGEEGELNFSWHVRKSTEYNLPGLV